MPNLDTVVNTHRNLLAVAAAEVVAVTVEGASLDRLDDVVRGTVEVYDDYVEVAAGRRTAVRFRLDAIYRLTIHA